MRTDANLTKQAYYLESEQLHKHTWKKSLTPLAQRECYVRQFHNSVGRLPFSFS